MLLLFCSILTIANGIVLNIPIKFNRPNWMNNSETLDLQSFFNTNESQINEISKLNCLNFKQTQISYDDNFRFESNCLKGPDCNTPTVFPTKYCPLYGSVNKIIFYLQNNTFDEAFYILAEGCYFYMENRTVKGDWYLSNENSIDLENLKELQTDFIDISDSTIMKCSLLCNGFDCYSKFKIELVLRFFSEDGEFKKIIIASAGGGLFILVVLIFIFYFFIKKFKGNINNFNT